MRKILCTLVAAAALLTSSVAMADDPVCTDPVTVTPCKTNSQLVPPSHPIRLGFGMDLGVPSGVALGLVLNPKLDWLRLQASLTYDYLSFGGRGSVQLDPMALIRSHHYDSQTGLVSVTHSFPFGVFADVQGGFQPTATIPGHNDLPGVGIDYVNLYGGLRFGSPNGFHWNFEAGPTYMHVSTSNFQSVISQSGLSLGNPTVNGWITPTFETGFTVVWP